MVAGLATRGFDVVATELGEADIVTKYELSFLSKKRGGLKPRRAYKNEAMFAHMGADHFRARSGRGGWGHLGSCIG